MADISKDIQAALSNVIIDQEYQTAKSNKNIEDTEFETYVDLFDSERPEKDYDWMSDISLPEFPAHMLTQSALDVSQYFVSRDFIGAYLEDESEQAKANADAAKECINRTLNQKHLHHYQKYTRGRLINQLLGKTYARCWWEQKTIDKIVGTGSSGKVLGKIYQRFGCRIADRVIHPLNPHLHPKVSIGKQTITCRPHVCSVIS